MKQRIILQDIIIKELQNSGLDGIELARHIKEKYDLPNPIDSIRSGIQRQKRRDRNDDIERKPQKPRSVDVDYDAAVDDDYDIRSVGEIARDGEGKITHYYYRIRIRDQQPLIGEFSREEMDKIYRLYSSNDGAGLNQRSVAREFPMITFRDFKRILRAFNITKDSIPIAPHVLEENTAGKAASIIRQNRENVVLKKLEEDRSKYFERLWRRTLLEYAELKENREYGQEFLKDLIQMDAPNAKVYKIVPKGNEMLQEKVAAVFYIADMHMGANTLKDSIYRNPWNEEEAIKCVQKVIYEINHIHRYYGRLDKIIFLHLGDGVDGMSGKTTRPGSSHVLPQNMNNKGQIRAWVKMMKLTLDATHELDAADAIEFYTTTDDNHSGDFLYGGYLALEEFCTWKYPDMHFEMFEEFIGYFEYGIHTFVGTHGKDKIHMKHGLPILIDEKTENRIVEYLDAHGLFKPDVHFIKGDLHQSARQSVARFDYKNVFSTYGSSAWAHINYGIGQPGVDYDIVWKDERRVLEGRIKFDRGSIWDQKRRAK